MGDAFAVGHGTVVVPADQYDPEHDQVVTQALWVHHGDAWTDVRASSGLPVGRTHLESVALLADGRVLAGNDDDGWWLASDATATAFRRIGVPAHFRRIVVGGDRLYGVGASSDTWVSDDAGRTWSTFDRDGR